MEYSEVKTILYQSEEIQQIPDRWEESIPFRIKIGIDDYDAFLYWVFQNNQVTLKRLIGINRRTAAILTLDASELQNCFGLPTVTFTAKAIKDYNQYFLNKERYESLYAEICSTEEAINAVGKEEYTLLKEIVGDDLTFNLFEFIAKDYISSIKS